MLGSLFHPVVNACPSPSWISSGGDAALPGCWVCGKAHGFTFSLLAHRSRQDQTQCQEWFNLSSSVRSQGAQAGLGLQHSLCVPTVLPREHPSGCCSPPCSPHWLCPRGCCSSEPGVTSLCSTARWVSVSQLGHPLQSKAEVTSAVPGMGFCFFLPVQQWEVTAAGPTCHWHRSASTGRAGG